MKILVNDVAASQGGAMSVLKDFYTYILNDEECKKHQWFFLLSGDYLDPMPHINILTFPEIKKSWLHRLKFDFYQIKKLIKQIDVDYVISLQNIMIWGIKQDQCVYIHQSIPFQTEKKFSVLKKKERLCAVYQNVIGFLIKQSAKRAKHVVVQTTWMKNAVSRLSKCELEKIAVVPFLSESPKLELKKEGVFDKNIFFYPAFHSIYNSHQ